ncbi:SsgA family sporulation/cell division regulator [Pseudonocardia alni]|uniref:SsgA family sporulation/cell division regulator n=1 Tax=Pseudonocardia alni TaxID=33907 RepID=UPI00280ABACD|nr:SsgA family sporulation/cell division regulator [Pseudonocardia alni]
MTNIQPTRGGFGLDEVHTQITGRIYQLQVAPALAMRELPVHVEMTYRRSRPLELEMRFRTCGETTSVTWCIGRELLTAGLTTASPEVTDTDQRFTPDIQISTHALPGLDWTLITLSSPSGTAEIGLPTYELIDFIDRTEDIVTPGAEGPLVAEADLVALFDDQGPLW